MGWSYRFKIEQKSHTVIHVMIYRDEGASKGLDIYYRRGVDQVKIGGSTKDFKGKRGGGLQKMREYERGFRKKI